MKPRDILQSLVAFPTVSRDSNLDLIAYVEGLLADAGIETTRVPNAEGDKAGLFASVGPDAPGGVVLSGHTDVVPTDGQDWATDPWVLTEKDGRLYGRGSVDMKGFDALAIAAMIQAAKSGDLKRPLQIALSYDEEVGCTGAPPLIEALLASGLPKAETALVGEPSDLKVVTGHKGGLSYHVHVRGHEVHSSIMHTGVNAIMEGAKLIDWANRTNATSMAATPGPLAAEFIPPWTTIHTGTIRGGTAHNITAADCHFDYDFRIVPGDDPADWQARFEAEVARLTAGMQAVAPSSGIDAAQAFTLPPLVPEEDGAAERLMRQLTGDNGTHVVSYGTEGGHFQAAGYSCVVCGPGDIGRAHKADEYITIDELEAGWAFMEKLLTWLRT